MIIGSKKEKAITLRKKGLSYNQISGLTNISKSTLSDWLSDLPYGTLHITIMGAKLVRRIKGWISGVASQF